MYKIIDKKNLAPRIFSLEIEAPDIARSALPGQFTIVIADNMGERVPLTICDTNLDRESVLLVVEEIGLSTRKLAKLKKGDYIKDFAGPLGLPSKLLDENVEELKEKKVLLVGGGTGAATLIPQGKWLKENFISFDAIIGARSKEFVLLEDKMKTYADEVFISTDDGSYGFHGFAVDLLDHLVKVKNKKYDFCVIVGPLIMMKFTSIKTKELGIPTFVSLNPIMVDGTGMCGACRVTIDGKTKFACVDGPEFDGHLVDFDEALRRQGQYKNQEKRKDHNYCELVGGMTDGQI